LIDATADPIGTFDSFTLFYTGGGNCIIEVGEFTKMPEGVVLLEMTRTGGSKWEPFNAEKLGRGMSTCATDSGPARFRGQLEDGNAVGIRVRAAKTLEMERIRVQITFAGGIFQHYISTEPNYVIEEVPDLRDFIK
jgi:hypothetical protein